MTISLLPFFSQGPGQYMVWVGPMFQKRPRQWPLTHATPCVQGCISRKVSLVSVRLTLNFQNAGPSVLVVVYFKLAGGPPALGS